MDGIDQMWGNIGADNASGNGVPKTFGGGWKSSGNNGPNGATRGG